MSFDGADAAEFLLGSVDVEGAFDVLETLLDLLILDCDNPRSLMYQVDHLLEDLRALPGHPGGGRVSEAEKPVLEASTALRVADTAQLSLAGPDSSRPQLDAGRSRRASALR